MDKWQKNSALSFNDHLKSNIQAKVEMVEAPKRRVAAKSGELKQEEYRGPYEAAHELHVSPKPEEDEDSGTIASKCERMLEKLRYNVRSSTLDQLYEHEGVERELTLDSNMITAQIQNELRKKGKLDDLNKITCEEEKPPGSQLSASGVSTKYLEGFINDKLLMAEKHNFPMVIRRPEHMHPLERYDLSRIQLLEIGLLQSEIDRLYRALYVYTFGFFAILKDYGAKLDNRMTKHKVDISNYLESNIWHVFQVLIDLACPQDYKGILAQKEDKHQKEMNKQYEYLTALEEEQIKKSAALRGKMAELQSELNEVETLKTQFYNEQRALTTKNTQLKERLEEEITLRMNFEQKINVGFMVNNQTAESYTLLRDKHERLQVENIKTENELKLLKVEYRKLQDFKDNNIDKIQTFNAEVNSHDIFRLDQHRKESQLHHLLAQIREEINSTKHENQQIKVKDASLHLKTQTFKNQFEAITKYSAKIQEFYDQQKVDIDKMNAEWKEDKDKIIELSKVIIEKDLHHTLDKVAYQDIKKQLQEKVQEYNQLQELKNASDMKCTTAQRMHVMADLKEGMNKKIKQTMVEQLEEVTANKIDTEQRLKLQMEHNHDLTQKNKELYILYKQMSLDAVNAHNQCDDFKVENERLKIQSVSLNARIREMNDSTKKQIVTLRQHIHFEQDERESQVEVVEKAKYHIEHFKKENQKVEHEVTDIKHELSRYAIENEMLKKQIKTITAEHHERLMDKNAEIYQLQELRDTNQTLQLQIDQKQNISQKEINIWKTKVNQAKIEINNIQMAINDIEAKKNRTDDKLQETQEVLETTKVELKRFKEKYYAVAIQMQFALAKKRKVETEAKEALRIRDKQAYDIEQHIKEIGTLRYKVETAEGVNSLQREATDQLLSKKMELEGQIANLKTEIERLESNVEELREVIREGKKEMAEGESQTTIKYFDSKLAQTGNELSVQLALRMSMSNMLKNKEYLESSKAVSTIKTSQKSAVGLGSQKSQNLLVVGSNNSVNNKRSEAGDFSIQEFPNEQSSDTVLSNDKADETSERKLNLDIAQPKAQDDGDISNLFLPSLIEENELDKLANHQSNPPSNPIEQIQMDAPKQLSQDLIINSGTHNSVETLQTMRFASKQEQTDAAVPVPPQPEHGPIADGNKEQKQSYQADAYQTIESKKSKKSQNKTQNIKAAKKGRPKTQAKENMQINASQEARKVSEKPLNRKIELISKFKTYSRILGKLILERPTSQFDSIQVAQAKRYLKTKNKPQNALVKQMTNILKYQLAYKVKVQEQNAEVQKEINKLEQMAANTVVTQDPVPPQPDQEELNSPGESSIQSFGNQLIRKKLTEETVIKFIEEKCQTNIRYLKKFITNLNNSDILKQHAKIDFEILHQDKKAFQIKDQFDVQKKSQQSKEQVATLAYKSNYDIQKYQDDRASIGMSPRTQTASTSFFKHDANFKLHRRSKNMSIMNQYKEDLQDNKDLIDVLAGNKSNKTQSQSQQRIFVKRNAARSGVLDGRLDSTNVNLQGGRLSILPHTRASMNVVDSSPIIKHRTKAFQDSLRRQQKDSQHRNSCQLIDIQPSFTKKKHNRFGSLDFLHQQIHQGTSTSQFIDHNQDDGQYPYQSINHSPDENQRMVTVSDEYMHNASTAELNQRKKQMSTFTAATDKVEPQPGNYYGVREKPRTSQDAGQRRKIRTMLKNSIISNV